MERLRLCFVGPAGSVVLQRWVEWFAARGHATTIVTVEPADPLTAPIFRQIDVGGRTGPRKLGRLISAVRMALVVRRLKPDVVHAQYLRGLAWGMPLVGETPCVATPWGSDVLEEQGAFREGYSRRLTRAVLKRADLVTVHSEYMEAQVRPLMPAGKPMARIGWGVDLARFRPGLEVRPLRQQWEIPEVRRVIFSPRLARPFYRHEQVIRALPAVREQAPEALLVIVEHSADAEYVRGLRRLASDLGVADHVRFVGAIPYPEMPGWLNLADVAVMVPPSDGMPSTLLEAMACGAVPVLNRLPQYAELIRHGENGLFVEPGSGDLAGALVAVLSDAALRAQIARRNRETVAAVADQDREMNRMEEWYARLATGRRPMGWDGLASLAMT